MYPVLFLLFLSAYPTRPSSQHCSSLSLFFLRMGLYSSVLYCTLSQCMPTHLPAYLGLRLGSESSNFEMYFSTFLAAEQNRKGINERSRD
ncbi:MAG: hypothetical protein J3R72DRAFT_447778 [Linnemannia gamsii]|nr:MAG: hypothetical protein J3R72DRAFT_447778 [Linnemannia gamsii]